MKDRPRRNEPERIIFKWLLAAILLVEGIKYLIFLVVR